MMIGEKKIRALFIDDDRATNFLNKYIANKSGSIDSVFISNSGFEAIDFLEKCIVEPNQTPNLIFLDINMPAMNGWEFLEKFYSLDEKIVRNINIVILSSSDDPGDLNKFKKNETLLDFLRKPLTEEALSSVLVKV